MRRHVVLAAGCALAVLLGSAPMAEAHPGQVAVTKAQAQKLVKAGVLKKGDMRGFAAAKYQADPADAEHDAAIYACLGAKAPKKIAEKDSNTFSKGPLQIDSNATVVDTAKNAKRDAKLVKSKKFAGCYEQEFRKALEADGITVEKFSVKLVAVSVHDADLALAIKYVITGTSSGIPVKVIGYGVSAVVGSTEIEVDPLRIDAVAPKLSQAVALLETLVARVRNV